MNTIISDPDTKINMSLDEIIRLTRKKINNRSRESKIKKNKAKFSKNYNSDHSMPLPASSEDVSILVSKKSPLLKPDIKKSFLKAVTNRTLNAELLKKSTRIIPAKYKLIKTDNGVERILVPVKNYICKPLKKLHQKNHCDCDKALHDDTPPLVSAPLVKTVHSPQVFKQKFDSKMDVNIEGGDDDDDDDDVVVLGSIKKEPEIIDVEMNMPISVLKNNNSPGDSIKTLNDRFTRLTGSFQF